MKTANKAKRRLKTIANIQLRELDRKMDEEQKKRYEQELSLYKRAVNQKKTTRRKSTVCTNFLPAALPRARHISNMNLVIKLG